MKLLLLALAITEVSAFAGLAVSKLHGSKVVVMHGGKGFGGGEATRDPAPTYIDPSDPKGKQQAIHKAESFAEYLARRGGGGGGGPPSSRLTGGTSAFAAK